MCPTYLTEGMAIAVSSETVWSPNPWGITVQRCGVMDSENYVDSEIPL